MDNNPPGPPEQSGSSSGSHPRRILTPRSRLDRKVKIPTQVARQDRHSGREHDGIQANENANRESAARLDHLVLAAAIEPQATKEDAVVRTENEIDTDFDAGDCTHNQPLPVIEDEEATGKATMTPEPDHHRITECRPGPMPLQPKDLGLHSDNSYPEHFDSGYFEGDEADVEPDKTLRSESDSQVLDESYYTSYQPVIEESFDASPPLEEPQDLLVRVDEPYHTLLDIESTHNNFAEQGLRTKETVNRIEACSIAHNEATDPCDEVRSIRYPDRSELDEIEIITTSSLATFPWKSLRSKFIQLLTNIVIRIVTAIFPPPPLYPVFQPKDFVGVSPYTPLSHKRVGNIVQPPRLTCTTYEDADQSSPSSLNSYRVQFPTRSLADLRSMEMVALGHGLFKNVLPNYTPASEDTGIDVNHSDIAVDGLSRDRQQSTINGTEQHNVRDCSPISYIIVEKLNKMRDYTKSSGFPAYASDNFDNFLNQNRSFVSKRHGTLDAAEGSLLQLLLSNPQRTPRDTEFESEDGEFQTLLNDLEEAKEIVLVKTIGRLLIPSPRARRHGFLRHHHDSTWSHCSHWGKLPKPDRSTGFRPEAFREHHLEKLAVWAKLRKSTFEARRGFHFPFLTAEAKAPSVDLDDADRQNAYSQTLAMQTLVELFMLAGRENQIHNKLLGFSISYRLPNIRISGHTTRVDKWPPTFHMFTIKKFYINESAGAKWQAYTFVRNIYDLWVPQHLKRIQATIEALPDPSEDLADMFADLELNIGTPMSQVSNSSTPASTASSSSTLVSTVSTSESSTPRKSRRGSRLPPQSPCDGRGR